MVKRFSGIVGLLFIWVALVVVFLDAPSLQADIVSEQEWRQVVELQSDFPQPFALFGSAIAIDDQFMVVGAIHESIPNYMHNGAAYIFQKIGNDWSQPEQIAHLTPSEPAIDLSFGASVAIQGDTIVIGSADGVYIFEKPGDGWHDMTETVKISSNLPNTHFGLRVALEGDLLVTTAEAENSHSGAVYVYQKPESGWHSTLPVMAKLTPSDSNMTEYFGHALEVIDGLIVVSKFSPDGGVYIFEEPVGGWMTATQTAKLIVPQTTYFGVSMAVTSEAIAAGAQNSEYVYLYEKPETGWADVSPTARLSITNPSSAFLLGRQIEMENDRLFTSAFLQGDEMHGVVYGYQRPITGWVDMTETTILTVKDRPERQDFGNSIVLYDQTLVIGDYEVGQEGAIYLFQPAYIPTFKATTSNYAPYNEQPVTMSIVLQNGSITLTDVTISTTLDSRFNIIGPIELEGITNTIGTFPEILTGVVLTPYQIMTLTVPITVTNPSIPLEIINNTAQITANELTEPIYDFSQIYSFSRRPIYLSIIAYSEPE